MLSGPLKGIDSQDLIINIENIDWDNVTNDHFEKIHQANRQLIVIFGSLLAGSLWHTAKNDQIYSFLLATLCGTGVTLFGNKKQVALERLLRDKKISLFFKKF